MKETKKLNGHISHILKVGSGLSMILMAVGFGMFLINPQHVSLGIHTTTISDVLRGALLLEPLGLMTLGIIILIITPFLSVTGAVFSFLFFERDKMYSLISLGVLAILIIGLFIPGMKH